MLQQKRGRLRKRWRGFNFLGKGQRYQQAPLSGPYLLLLKPKKNCNEKEKKRICFWSTMTIASFSSLYPSNHKQILNLPTLVHHDNARQTQAVSTALSQVSLSSSLLVFHLIAICSPSFFCQLPLLSFSLSVYLSSSFISRLPSLQATSSLLRPEYS